MIVWQLDFDRRPLEDTQGHPLWELVVYDPQTQRADHCLCPEPQVNTQWLVTQLTNFGQRLGATPDGLQVFRPSHLPLWQTVSDRLQIPLETTPHTPGLKQVLRDRARQVYPAWPEYTGQVYDPLTIDWLPPQPVPEQLWGENWQFAALAATELELGLLRRPIPIQPIAPVRLPSQIGLNPSTPIPGVIIKAGSRSMPLAQWLQQRQPVHLQAISAELSGLILGAGLNERYVLATYADPEIEAAAQTFAQRKQNAQGLHFLLVQPDDSGVTFTGVWLLVG